jgi:signal transduction histidine kinase
VAEAQYRDPPAASADRAGSVGRVAVSRLARISRAAFANRPLGETLRILARESVPLLDVDRVAIAFAGADGTWVVSSTCAGAAPLEPRLAHRLRVRLARDACTIIADAGADRDRTVWRAMLGTQVRVLLAAPFGGAGTVGGALVAGAEEAGIEAAGRPMLVEVLALQIGLAIRTARLGETHQHQMVALARMAAGLRAQSFEHVSELLAIQRSLDEGSIEQIEALVAQYREPRALNSAHVGNPIVAGLVLGEMSVARTRGVKLRLTAHSWLDSVPSGLGELGFVSVLSNLIANAFDAVASVPPPRRRVTLDIRQRPTVTTLQVRDWGVGLGSLSERDVLRAGYSSKGPGRGTGMALVSRLVSDAGGRVEIAPCPIGTRVRVEVPNG